MGVIAVMGLHEVPAVAGLRQDAAAAPSLAVRLIEPVRHLSGERANHPHGRPIEHRAGRASPIRVACSVTNMPRPGFAGPRARRYRDGMKDIPVIETARLRLRAPEHRDFEAYAAMWADDRVTRYISGKARPRDESWRRFIGTHGLWALLGFGYWIFAERESDTLIGIGGLADFQRGLAQLESYPEAGWAIAPDWWGRGIASEAMTAAMDWADHALDAAETRCIINPGHGASEAVARRLGFVRIDRAELNADPVNVYARRKPGAPEGQAASR